MRRLGEYDFKKMSDSRIMYLQRPPNFLVIFLVFVIIVLVGLCLWSNVAVKADTVETAGIIVSVDKTPLTLETDGKIAKIHVKEGEYANKGDVLLTLDTGQLKNEMAKYEYLQEYYEERILYIDMFLTEIANILFSALCPNNRNIIAAIHKTSVMCQFSREGFRFIQKQLKLQAALHLQSGNLIFQ